VEFCDKMGIPYFKEDVFRVFNVDHTSSWKDLRESSRRHHNNASIDEARGRHFIVTPQKIREMEWIMKKENVKVTKKISKLEDIKFVT
jgi:hypothetical protein